MKTVACHCGHSFEADISERVDLDASEGDVEAILNGSFLSLSCPSCKGELRPEIRVAFNWKDSGFTWLPESERWRFLHNPQSYVSDEKVDTPSIVFGYTELAERVAILRDGLDILSIEFVKLMLLAKVPEASRSDSLAIRYLSTREGDLVFLVSGLPEDRSAELRFPAKTWQVVLADREKLAADDAYSSMIVGPYISYTNVDFEGDQSAPTDSATAE